jgi:hypothetical protein
MATFNYRIFLDDSELIAVEAALHHYRSICVAKLVEGAKAPYWAHRRSIDAVLSRLSSDRRMTSTSNFGTRRPAGGNE